MTGPRTLDELLAACPGVGRMRAVNAATLRVLLDRSPGDCTWCGLPVGKGRQTWCGPACVRAFELRCSPTHQRKYVAERDGGVCRACGRDVVAAEAEAAARRLNPWPSCRPGESPDQYAIRKGELLAALRALGYARGRFCEVDHDPPVCERGGLGPVEQLKLLCGVCHEAATAALAARRKRGRG